MTGKVLDSENYLTLQKINGNLFFFNKKIYKIKNKYFNAFSGIAGIYDYKNFWKGIEKENKKNPLEVFEGLKNIKNLKIINADWLDTGTVEKYKKTNAKNNRQFFATNLNLQNDQKLGHEGGRRSKNFHHKIKPSKK
jgi:hypothetical protein